MSDFMIRKAASSDLDAIKLLADRHRQELVPYQSYSCTQSKDFRVAFPGRRQVLE